MDRQGLLAAHWTPNVLMPAQTCPICFTLVGLSDESKEGHVEWHFPVAA